jgi:phosphopantetheinyl transferase (holo-ACP synthase)
MMLSFIVRSSLPFYLYIADPRPQLVFEGEAKAYMDSLGLSALMSLSHDGDHAIASVILQQELQ